MRGKPKTQILGAAGLVHNPLALTAFLRGPFQVSLAYDANTGIATEAPRQISTAEFMHCSSTTHTLLSVPC